MTLIALLLGGYVVADAADLVPGVLTTAPRPAAAEPFPDVSIADGDGALLLPGLDPEAPVPSTDDVAARVADLLAADAVGPSAGVLVADVLTGEDLHAHDAEAAHVPASTTKLLTAAAAVAAAGPDHRFVTRVLEAGADGIVLVGGGDIALARGAGDPTAVVGHAGLADLADATATALAEQDRTEVALTVDTSYYSGPALAPRWDSIDLAAGDAMAMAPLAIDVGVSEGTRVRSVDPAGDAAAAFAAALESRGVEVTTITDGVAAADAPELAAVESAPLADLAAYMLQVSENILAEGIGRLVAHEVGEEPNFVGAGLAIDAALSEIGVDTSGLSLADSAGLSSTNRIAPRTLVQTLLLVAESPDLGAVARGLPVAGLEGTLATRLDEPPAAGMVNAKTGTLLAVVSLSGYVRTVDGRLLAFAVLVDDVPTGGIAGARAAVDAFTNGLARCGC